jgi:hypothetical protein
MASHVFPRGGGFWIETAAPQFTGNIMEGFGEVFKE